MLSRIITAVIGIPIGLFLIHYGDLPLLITAMIFGVLGLFEISDISYRIQYPVLKSIAVPGLIFLLVGFHFVNWIAILFIISLIVLSLSIYILFTYPQNNFNTFGGTITAIIYLSWIFGFTLAIRTMDGGFFAIVYLLLIIWGTDSGAYFIGLKFGKNKLVPHISPKKSVEGAFGGILIAAIFSLIFFNLIGVNILTSLIIGVLISVLAQIGDLFESSFKRIAQIKDSGNILPGHGGILDRFDSFFFAVPFYFFILRLINLL
ncbi:phosphatidate cytidylyltransferase [Natranaerobius trueperi]|uniref:Phosphatidate cytidylyltransferase n=1 Tax=Natranaerobius trueperi TaxID=759412 RepID=A0A226BZ43_9FIRM|nr:phosphatidate cytidylyltransferase [Natranaerobius trueperi]OWZ84266.1 phosphatidate cytidylyltransferase [Natranaerobius trueperi]